MKVKNTGDKARNLSLFSYLEFSFHHIMIDNQNYQMSLYCAGASYEDGIIEEDLFYEEEGYQYFTADFAPDGFDCMRDKFLGTYNTETNPAAVIAGQCFSSYEKGGNYCGSLQKNVTLQPGEEVRFIFMLGEGRRDEGRRIRAKYADHGAGCHDDSPLESRKVQGADRAASQGAYERGLRAASVPAGMVYGRHGRKAF